MAKIIELAMAFLDEAGIGYSLRPTNPELANYEHKWLQIHQCDSVELHFLEGTILCQAIAYSDAVTVPLEDPQCFKRIVSFIEKYSWHNEL